MKKSIKRACAAAMSAVLGFSLMTFTAAGAAAYTANEPADIYTYELDVTLGGEYGEAVQKIYEAMENCESSVDVSEFGVSTSNAVDVYEGVVSAHPELFYIKSTYSYGYNSSTGKVTSYKISYSYDTSEIPAMKEEFADRVDEVMALVSENMTDLEKAVVLHDELAASCNYDQTLQKSNAYNALVEGEAVCQGYSYAYAYLLSLAGVKSEYATSESMVHMWNKVCIDDEWYNVDVTWDDPTSAARGQAEHNCFLLSDAKLSSDDMGSQKHYDYVSVHEASDTSYDDALLHSLDTRLCNVSGSCYAICNDTSDTYAKSLVKYDLANDTAETVKKFSYKWSAGGNAYYADAFIALQVYDGLLYFNTPTSLCSYDVNTGEQSTVVENVLDDDASETAACYGIVLSGNDIYAAIAEGPGSSYNTEIKLVASLEVPEPAAEPAIGVKAQVTLSDGTTATVYYGDADSDGKITIADVTCVQKSLARFTELDELQKVAADADFDGIVTIKDATDVQKYIAGME